MCIATILIINAVSAAVLLAVLVELALRASRTGVHL
jgi:hypothetical protein